MTQKELIEYWLAESDKDYNSMLNIAKSRENHWVLFIGHLSVEKALKALYVQNNEKNVVPKIHSLVKLAELANLDVSDEMFVKLSTITLFNIQARYPDYKKKFRNTCTDEYTKEKIICIREVLDWLKSEIKK